MPQILNPTSAWPLLVSCADRFAMYAQSCPVRENVRRPIFKSTTQGLLYPAVTSSSRRNTARWPAAAMVRACAAVGSSPATATIPAASARNVPRYAGTNRANPAREVLISIPASTAATTRR